MTCRFCGDRDSTGTYCYTCLHITNKSNTKFETNIHRYRHMLRRYLKETRYKIDRRLERK